MAHEVFKRLYLYKALSFVIIGATCPNASVTHLRLKRIRVPQIQRVNRHHIIVAIHQHGGCRIAHMLFGIHQRITLRRHHLGMVGTGSHQQFLPTFGTAQHVIVVCRFGADTRNAYQAEQLVKETRLVLYHIALYSRNCCHKFCFNYPLAKIVQTE